MLPEMREALKQAVRSLLADGRFGIRQDSTVHGTCAYYVTGGASCIVGWFIRNHGCENPYSMSLISFRPGVLINRGDMARLAKTLPVEWLDPQHQLGFILAQMQFVHDDAARGLSHLSMRQRIWDALKRHGGIGPDIYKEVLNER